MNTNNKRSSRIKRRGYSLLELILFATLWAILAVATFRVVGDSRVVRSRAEDRLQMLQIAQSELDRLRSGGIEEIGDAPFHREEWPAGLFVTVAKQPRPDGTIEVTLTVSRPRSIEGTKDVSLTTLVAGAKS